MNLFWRLIIVMIAAFRSSKFGIWGTSELSLNVKAWDVSADALKYGRLQSFGDLGTLHYLVRSGILRALRANDWSPIIVSKEFLSFGDIRKGDALTFTTRLIGWREHYSCLLHEVYRDGQLIAEGHTIGRFIALPGRAHPTVDLVSVKTGFPGAESPSLPSRILDIFQRLEEARLLSKRQKG